MVVQYRVVDVRSDEAEELIVTKARSPEDAAFQAIGEMLVRSGRRNELRARVYFQESHQPVTMVRLYRRVEDRV
jgi:hypothetical protein